MRKISFETNPNNYLHWNIEIRENLAFLTMNVNEDGGMFDGYQLKLNSYDLSVDIELFDAIQRLRFEHPEVSVVVLKSGNDKAFSAGANIKMLASASHAHKVNFCKFTNETRNYLESSSQDSLQYYICLIDGVCAGGGYELALACDHIVLMDDGSSNVALPEVPLLAVLPGTGGLTRVTDKRKVRRDLADVFCTMEEGVKAQKAKEWKLVDTITKKSSLDEDLNKLIVDFSKKGKLNKCTGIKLNKLEKSFVNDDYIKYSTIDLKINREKNNANIIITSSDEPIPNNEKELENTGDKLWLLRCVRELDDALLHIRFNELEIGVIIFSSSGNIESVLKYDKLFHDFSSNWFIREIKNSWERTLKRIDLTSRSLVTLVEPGSCFAGFLSEIVFCSDRTYMAEGDFEGNNKPEASLSLTDSNFDYFKMSNGLSRLKTRFLEQDDKLTELNEVKDKIILSEEAKKLGLITFSFDDIDWDDEIRIFLEERASFSPDSMTGMESNLRFAGPETMETKIFGRLTAWQNWIFQRPNASGEEGALKKYGTGNKGKFNKQRV